MNSEIPLDQGFSVRECMTRTGERTQTGAEERVLDQSLRALIGENEPRPTRRERLRNGARSHSFAPSTRATGRHGRGNRFAPSIRATGRHGRGNRFAPSTRATGRHGRGNRFAPSTRATGRHGRGNRSRPTEHPNCSRGTGSAMPPDDFGQPGQRECIGRGQRGRRFAGGNRHPPNYGAVGNHGDRFRVSNGGCGQPHPIGLTTGIARHAFGHDGRCD